MKKLDYGIYPVKYEDIGKEVMGVILGDGSINIMDLINEDTGFFGIGFAETEIGEIGRTIYSKDGEPSPKFEDTDCQFHIISDNVKSLDVLIARLNEVRNELESFQNSRKTL